MALKLDDWQKEIIEYDGNCLLCTGRQVGKTTTFAIKAAKYLINHNYAKIIVVSLTEDQARLIIAMVLDYLEKFYKNKIETGKKKPTQNIITLKNKSQIIARPVGNTGDAVRGFTGNVLIIDEASRMPALMWAASKPTLLTTAGQIWMCSTPAGKEGYFWEAFQNKGNRFKVWHKSSEEVIYNRPLSSSWTKEKREAAIKFLEEEKKDMSELQYGQEYLGLFLEDLRRFFPDKLIESTCILKRDDPMKKEETYMGVDIARMGGDLTAYEILNIPYPDAKIRQVENITEQYKLTTHTEQRILELNKTWDLRRIGVDAGAGSLGVGIYDHLLEHPETRKKVVAMNNRQISMDREGKRQQRIFKEDLYDNLRAMMEHSEILLLDDDDVKLSLRNIQFEILKDKGMPTKVRIFGRDSHIAEGLIRAAWLAKKEKSINFKIYYM